MSKSYQTHDSVSTEYQKCFQSKSFAEKKSYKKHTNSLLILNVKYDNI